MVFCVHVVPATFINNAWYNKQAYIHSDLKKVNAEVNESFS